MQNCFKSTKSTESPTVVGAIQQVYGVLRPNELEIKDFTSKVESWITLFTTLYQTRHVTPYIHVLVAHITKFLRDQCSLSKFSQQGFEKLNDDITKAYFKSTNHHIREDAYSIILLFPIIHSTPVVIPFQ